MFEIFSLKILLLCIVAFIAGLINSIAGGGGLITLPAIVLLNLPAHVALGTNKMQAVSGSFFSNLVYILKKKTIWKVAAIGMPLAFIGSIVGARLTFNLPSTILTKVIIFLLPPATFFMFFSNALLKRKKVKLQNLNTNRLLWSGFASFTIGMYDGFYGPGTGTFLILFLVLVTHLPLINASATSKTLNFASNIGAFFTFLINGSIIYTIAIPMAIFNILGSITGTRLAIKKGNKLVQKFVYLSITILFIYLVWNNYIK
jgi:uncharacterized protein